MRMNSAINPNRIKHNIPKTIDKIVDSDQANFVNQPKSAMTKKAVT